MKLLDFSNFKRSFQLPVVIFYSANLTKICYTPHSVLAKAVFTCFPLTSLPAVGRGRLVAPPSLAGSSEGFKSEKQRQGQRREHARQNSCGGSYALFLGHFYLDGGRG